MDVLSKVYENLYISDHKEKSLLETYIWWIRKEEGKIDLKDYFKNSLSWLIKDFTMWEEEVSRNK